MDNLFHICSRVTLQDGGVWLNDQCVLQTQPGTDALSLAKEVYQHFQFNYPKFFKMDLLSKLAFLGAEILIQHDSRNYHFTPEKTAVILCNSSSSLNTDRKYQEGIQSFEEFTPAPALFVYTLPNIAVGEICIRNQCKGNNIFFVMDNFDMEFVSRYISIQIQKGELRHAVLGWCEVAENSFEVRMFLCEANPVST